jgi:hypothetical protein
VPEEFALDQVLRHGRHVDDHQRFTPPRAVGMNRFSDQFFARARLAPDQDRGVDLRHSTGLLEYRQHQIGRSHDLLKRQFAYVLGFEHLHGDPPDE